MIFAFLLFQLIQYNVKGEHLLVQTKDGEDFLVETKDGEAQRKVCKINGKLISAKTIRQKL